MIKKGQKKMPRTNPLATKATTSIAAPRQSNVQSQLDILRRANAPENGAFMKVTEMCKLIYGEDEIEVEDGSLWAVNPNSLQVGFITWSEDDQTTAPLEEKMAFIIGDNAESEILRSDMENHPNSRTNSQMAISVSCLTGADKGQLCQFKSSSMKGRASIERLWRELVGAMPEDSAKTHVPVVSLAPTIVKNKKKGSTRFVEFTLTAVLTNDEAAELTTTGKLPK